MASQITSPDAIKPGAGELKRSAPKLHQNPPQKKL